MKPVSSTLPDRLMPGSPANPHRSEPGLRASDWSHAEASEHEHTCAGKAGPPVADTASGLGRLHVQLSPTTKTTTMDYLIVLFAASFIVTYALIVGRIVFQSE